MIPARDCLEFEMLSVGTARLRTARFAADPARTARGARGVCVLLNGQTEFVEKYFEVIDELRGRGFAVATLDWRGQGGSGRLVPDAPLRVHIDDFAEYDADLSAFMDKIVAPMLDGRQRPIAVAHSMGGHILLNYLSRNPQRFAAAAFSAPMLMFSTRGQPRWLVRAITCAMMLLGQRKDGVWGMASRDPLTMTFERQIVTSDPARFQRTQDFLKRHPDLRTCGPTWGWVTAADRSIAHFTAQGFAEKISTPVLIVAAGRDRIVITEAAQRFAARMPACVYQAIEDAEHEILMERDELRSQFWRAFDGFIERLP
jgi:lysophospholipase